MQGCIGNRTKHIVHNRKSTMYRLYINSIDLKAENPDSRSVTASKQSMLLLHAAKAGVLFCLLSGLAE